MSAPVRIYTRYRSKRGSSRKSPTPGWLFPLLCLGLAGILAWVWWRHADWGRHAQRPASPTAAPAPVSPAGGRAGSPLPAGRLPTAPPGLVLPASNASVVSTQETARLTPSNAPTVGAGIVRPVQNVFEAQVAMAREGISAGSIDGAMGSQTRAALRAYQRKHGLPPSGALDEETRARLLVALPLYTNRVVSSNELRQLMPMPQTWLGKSEQPRLDYQTLLELVAEKAFAHPQLIRQLNPGFDWEHVPEGALLTVPNVQYPVPSAKAAVVRISLSERTLEAFDGASNLLAHFPCSIGRLVEKRPVGELRVVVAAPDPNYTFNPEIFPESEEARQLGRKLILPPGPNNPVGTAWIGLDRPGYGIHGTPLPELVGRTESHGCFRLANWNADYLRQLVTVGTLVLVEP